MSKFVKIELKEDEVPGAKLTGDFEKYTNVHLKRYLECRGLKTSGNRVDLLKRCREASVMKKPIDVKVDAGKWMDKKVQELNKNDKSPRTGWKDFKPDFLPPLFNYGHVYVWLVESMPKLSANDLDSEEDEDDLSSLTEKQLNKDRQYLSSGLGNAVQAKSMNTGNLTYFKCTVDASMRQLSYSVTVTLSSISGSVRDATCHCKGSALNRCSHVAGLLLYLSDSVGSADPACTSLPCQWKKGKRKKEPTSINKAVYNENDSVKKIINFDPRPEQYRDISDSSINRFLSDLSSANIATGVTSMWETVLVKKIIINSRS